MAMATGQLVWQIHRGQKNDVFGDGFRKWNLFVRRNRTCTPCRNAHRATCTHDLRRHIEIAHVGTAYIKLKKGGAWHPRGNTGGGWALDTLYGRDMVPPSGSSSSKMPSGIVVRTRWVCSAECLACCCTLHLPQQRQLFRSDFCLPDVVIVVLRCPSTVVQCLW